jgi:hypothetical protein
VPGARPPANKRGSVWGCCEEAPASPAGTQRATPHRPIVPSPPPTCACPTPDLRPIGSSASRWYATLRTKHARPPSQHNISARHPSTTSLHWPGRPALIPAAITTDGDRRFCDSGPRNRKRPPIGDRKSRCWGGVGAASICWFYYAACVPRRHWAKGERAHPSREGCAIHLAYGSLDLLREAAQPSTVMKVLAAIGDQGSTTSVVNPVTRPSLVCPTIQNWISLRPMR